MTKLQSPKPKWWEEFDVKFVLDPSEVFFGKREELEKQGWEVGKSKRILRQNIELEELKSFIAQQIQRTREELLEEMDKKRKYPAGKCFICNSDGKILTSMMHPDDADEHYAYYNQAIDDLRSLVHPDLKSE